MAEQLPVARPRPGKEIKKSSVAVGEPECLPVSSSPEGSIEKESAERRLLAFSAQQC